jgi:hypothetical protein
VDVEALLGCFLEGCLLPALTDWTTQASHKGKSQQGKQTYIGFGRNSWTLKEIINLLLQASVESSGLHRPENWLLRQRIDL